MTSSPSKGKDGYNILYIHSERNEKKRVEEQQSKHHRSPPMISCGNLVSNLCCYHVLPSSPYLCFFWT
ncbi:hypothetical protein BDE02_04G038300 [Populus trichocarpa]|nr:hypothetical protein BDE02_04G038300 [Populus trichocarpa]